MNGYDWTRYKINWMDFETPGNFELALSFLVKASGERKKREKNVFDKVRF